MHRILSIHILLLTLFNSISYTMEDAAMREALKAYNQIVQNQKPKINKKARSQYLYHLAALIVDSARHRTSALLHPEKHYQPMSGAIALPNLVLQAHYYMVQSFEQQIFQHNEQLSTTAATSQRKNAFIETELKLLHEHYARIITALVKMKKTTKMLVPVICLDSIEPSLP